MEWGFSINNNLVENLQESSLIAKHLVLDHMSASENSVPKDMAITLQKIARK